MSREIWNSTDGFVGTFKDKVDLAYCMTCVNRNCCDTPCDGEHVHYEHEHGQPQVFDLVFGGAR